MAAQDRGRAAAQRAVAAAIPLAIAALHLWLVAGLPVCLLVPAAVDDGLYLRSADHVAAGDWLGRYDNRTLARGPFYPIFVALASHAGVPLRVAQSAFYLAACALLLWAVHPWPGPRWTRVATFGALAFDPMLYYGDLLRVAREGVYVPLTVLVLALCAASLRARDAKLAVRAAWAIALGGAVGALWLTREEGPWILPALASGALALAATRRGSPGLRSAWARDAGVIALAAAVAIACVQQVSWLNYRLYGTWCAVEFRQRAFARGYGALLRIDPDQRIPYVPVTRAALSNAAIAGPATAQIAWVIASGRRDGYVRYGCDYHHLDPCDREFRGGWFMFAVRDAAAIAGHYGSAAEAERFWNQVADEIDAACAAGRLACGPRRRGFAPPLAPGDLAAIAATGLRGAVQVVRFTGFELAPAASEGSDAELARYAALLHSRVFPPGDPPAEFSDPADRTRAGILRAIAHGYSWLVPPFVVAALAACAWQLRRGSSAVGTPWLAVAAMLGVATASRIALVSVVTATSIPILNPRYLSAAYPLLVAFAGVAVAGALDAWATRSRRR
jgi:hypothetical protein